MDKLLSRSKAVVVESQNPQRKRQRRKLKRKRRKKMRTKRKPMQLLTRQRRKKKRKRKAKNIAWMILSGRMEMVMDVLCIAPSLKRGNLHGLRLVVTMEAAPRLTVVRPAIHVQSHTELAWTSNVWPSGIETWVSVTAALNGRSIVISLFSRQIAL
jgi:hypothetical protein